MRDQQRDRAGRRRDAARAAAYRSNRACSVCGVERRGRLVEHERAAGRGRIIARPRASFCHWPPESSTPLAVAAAELRLEPVRQRLEHVGRRAGSSAAPIATGVVVELRAGRRRRPSRARSSSKRAKSWKPAAIRARQPLDGRRARRSTPSTADPAGRRLVEAAEQLDERRLAGAVLADDRDRRPGRQIERDVAQHVGRGAGVAKRHALELDAVASAPPAPGAGRWRRRARPPRRSRAARGSARPSRRTLVSHDPNITSPETAPASCVPSRTVIDRSPIVACPAAARRATSQSAPA